MLDTEMLLLKEKYQESLTKEMLTILHKSWSVQKVQKVFQVLLPV
jgi:hypothetical protein